VSDSPESAPAPIQIHEIDPRHPDATWCLEQYYSELDRVFEGGFDVARSLVSDPGGARRPHGVFVLARLGDRPVGCGMVVPTSPEVGYIKRMWVDSEVRGRGLGGRLLGALEGAARELGCVKARLETNRALTGAIRMYRRSGYLEVPPFNDEFYSHHWFEKVLED
jgi:GNAT superfamily N-acetyltransferase